MNECFFLFLNPPGFPTFLFVPEYLLEEIAKTYGPKSVWSVPPPPSEDEVIDVFF